MICALSSHPDIANAVCRLKAGIPHPTDFRDFLVVLRDWSESADKAAIYGQGPLGETAKGVAQAYRAILDAIDKAEPSKDEADDASISSSPSDSRGSTGFQNDGGQPAPPP